MAWVCANGGVVAGRALVASGAELPCSGFNKNAVHGQQWYLLL